MRACSTAEVSVVIPCYGQARYLTQTIQSLAEQTLAAWEAIIVNDGSLDDTEEVATRLSEADRRVRYVAKANGGLSSARNAGLAAALGEFVQFLDADDALERDKLARQLEFLRRRTDVDIVYGNAMYFKDGDPTCRVRNGHAVEVRAHIDWISRRAHNPLPIRTKFARWNQFPVCSPLVRKSLLDRVGGFDEGLRALEDWEFWIRAAEGGASFEFLELPQTDALIRLHQTSMSNDKSRMLKAEYEMAAVTLAYIREPALRRLVLERAVVAMQGLTGPEWQLADNTMRAAAAGSRETTALIVYATLGRRVNLPPLARRVLNRFMPSFFHLLVAAQSELSQ